MSPGRPGTVTRPKPGIFWQIPTARHVHLMERLNAQLKEESIRDSFKHQLKVLESRRIIEQKKIAEHRAAKEAIEAEIDATRDNIDRLETGVPLESDKSLEYSRHVKRQ